MAKRFHINPRTGNPGECSARISCPYGSLTEDHFDSPEAARTAFEAGQLDNAFSTLKKAVDEVIDEAASPTPVPRDDLLGPDQIAHTVGDVIVSTRVAPSLNARGEKGAVLETLAIAPNGEELYSSYATEWTAETKDAQHQQALAWMVANPVAAAPQEEDWSEPLTDEMMQEMDDYFREQG